MSEIYSLSELNSLIRSVIDASFPDTVLVTAEIASCDVKKHCYMTLIDKDDDIITAEIRAVIWSNRFRAIAEGFERATGARLSKGIKILFQAEIRFHERYGLKLNILNIDPSYTIGELAVKRKEILERLAREDLIDRNKELAFPLVPQRIGIISSSTAAGYEDLMAHLTHNPYGYTFSCRLYEALMQGDNAEESIVNALNQCMDDAAQMDIVVMVRGGGGQADLHCFDSYEIGKAIALLPVPVVSGIGHERDITVVDEVSHRRAKTPTAVADMIITAVKEFEDRIDASAHDVMHGVNILRSHLKESLLSVSKRLEIAAGNELRDNVHRLAALLKGLFYCTKCVQNEKQKCRTLESSITHLDPLNILKRGYSITYHNGRAVKTAGEVSGGDRLRTVLNQGEITSRVESAKKRRGKI
jgi:exodeoxyribonuclease VII large subunit